MARQRYLSRKLELFSISSTVGNNAGPYTEVIEAASHMLPFERDGMFGRRIRFTKAYPIGKHWLLEAFLLVPNLDVFEVDTKPAAEDDPVFLRPNKNRTFAYRTCALIDFESRRAVIEYVRNGPKAIDFSEVFTDLLSEVAKSDNANFAFTPLINSDFIKQVKELEQIKQIRIVFERPNPGWGDISILNEELDATGDARREVVSTAPRGGSLNQGKGMAKFVEKSIANERSGVDNVIVEGRRIGEPGIVRLNARDNITSHRASLPLTDDGVSYQKTFENISAPLLQKL